MLRLISDSDGDAAVEAAILFPIMIMIFAALVVLAIYLPTRAALQRATQYAATALATERSDTWLYFDDDSMSYCWESEKGNLKNVYVALFQGSAGIDSKGEKIVIDVENRSITSKVGSLDVESRLVNRIVYKEVIVKATRKFPSPVDLSFIGFPEAIIVTVASTAVVQNGDEFVRNMDIAVDFVKYIVKKFNLTDIADSISTFGNKIVSLLGL